MECAYCHHQLSAGERICPVCGREAHAQDALAELRVVEGWLDASELDQLCRMTAREAAPADNDSRALIPLAPTHPALTALSRLPALAWRQPIVRSAVKTGASALALTVALRLVGHMIGRMVVSRGGRQMARASVLPMLAEILQQGEQRPDGRTVTRRGRSGEVVETFIYLRRTVRL
jgi:hypothetical protein